MRFLALVFLLLLAACSCPKYDYPVKGASDFVIDSYKIRQGKFAILEMEGKPVECLPPGSFDEYVDVIDEDDVLTINVYHPTRKDITDAVNQVGNSAGYRVIQGRIRLPELPSIEVAGLTLEEAKDRIQRAYDQEIHEAEVFIDYKQRLLRTVELIGMAAIHSVPVNGRIRLFDVLSTARINPGANLFMSYVVRCGKVLRVDLSKLIKEGDMCQNIIMRPRDKIYIADPSETTAMVMGEVSRPSVLMLARGMVSLREAIVAAGGIPFTGDKSCIQVIRGSIKCPKVYLLDWNLIVTLPNDSLLLMPGDTVYVSEKPITQWNRFIEQLLPTSMGVQQMNSTRMVLVQ